MLMYSNWYTDTIYTKYLTHLLSFIFIIIYMRGKHHIYIWFILQQKVWITVHFQFSLTSAFIGQRSLTFALHYQSIT